MEPCINRWRCSVVMGPIRLCGGYTRARSTMPGVPLSSRKETSASPTASSVMAFCTSSLGFVRKVSAAARSAFWQMFEKASEQPQQERRVKLGGLIELVSRENVHHAVPIRIRLYAVIQVQCRFAKKLRSSLLLDGQQPPLNRANTCRRDVSILGLKLPPMVADVLQHGLQILHVK